MGHPAAVPAAAIAGESLVGEAVFNPVTNSAESGLLNSWKVARYGWGWYEYGTLYGPTGRLAGMYVLRMTIAGLHFPYPLQ